jgi:UDP-arabinose 4-epimerase
MTQSVLVTGGAGYIGAHACKALAAAGFLPVTFDNLSLGRPEAVKWGPLVQGDTRNAAAVSTAIRAHSAIAVMHFAALSAVGESGRDPARYYHNNVGGLMGVLEGMALEGCRQIVFSSTAAVYGEAGEALIGEDAPVVPVNVYGRSKRMCETIMTDHAAANLLRPVSLRYFNASGADATAEIGEQREVETHLIPRALMALLGHVDDFQVFGSDFATPDGTAIRDYIHVSDLADAHVLALQYLLTGAEGGVFNLGTGQGYSVGEVLRTVERITGRAMAAPTGARREGDPTRLVADGSRARTDLGFQPTQSSLDNIVSTAWNWHQKAHPQR